MNGRLIATLSIALATAGISQAPIATADPPAPCGTPGIAACAGPGPLTPEQRCALVAAQMWLPCNWVINEPVPTGTPGSM